MGKNNQRELNEALQLQQLASDIKAINTLRLPAIEKAINDAVLEMRQNYVTRGEFNPVRSIVYGMVGIILVAVLGALVALVLK